jgi:hypothetical protein
MAFEVHIKMCESLPDSGGREVCVANPNQLLQAHLCAFTYVSHIIFLLLTCFFSFGYSTDAEDLVTSTSLRRLIYRDVE